MTPRANTRRRRLLWVAAIVVAVAVVAVYAIFDPATTPFPRCLFKTVTGYDCPGCGSQRAIHSLLNGDIVGAWGYNAMLVAMLPFLAMLVTSEVAAKRDGTFYRALHSPIVCYLVLVIILAWWLLRNIF